MREWNEYCRRLLGEVEWRVVSAFERELQEDGKNELEKRGGKDVESVEGKAIREDGIPNEIWRYGEVWIYKICKRVEEEGEGDSSNYKKGRGGEC